MSPYRLIFDADNQFWVFSHLSAQFWGFSVDFVIQFSAEGHSSPVITINLTKYESLHNCIIFLQGHQTIKPRESVDFIFVFCFFNKSLKRHYDLQNLRVPRICYVFFIFFKLSKCNNISLKKTENEYYLWLLKCCKNPNFILYFIFILHEVLFCSYFIFMIYVFLYNCYISICILICFLIFYIYSIFRLFDFSEIILLCSLYILMFNTLYEIIM